MECASKGSDIQSCRSIDYSQGQIKSYTNMYLSKFVKPNFRRTSSFLHSNVLLSIMCTFLFDNKQESAFPQYWSSVIARGNGGKPCGVWSSQTGSTLLTSDCGEIISDTCISHIPKSGHRVEMYTCTSHVPSISYLHGLANHS